MAVLLPLAGQMLAGAAISAAVSGGDGGGKHAPGCAHFTDPDEPEDPRSRDVDPHVYADPQWIIAPTR